MTAAVLASHPDGDDGMGPPGPPPWPPRFYRIGHAPQLPRSERIGRLLQRLGVYLMAWSAVGFGCWWIALGDLSGYGFIALGALACLLLPTSKRRASRPQTSGAPDRRAHYSQRDASALGRLARPIFPRVRG